MLNITNTAMPVAGVTHPLIADMYLKKDFSHNNENVLVIEARNKRGTDGDDAQHESFDSYLIDLLTDLEDLKKQAERQVGGIDRIDIRTS